MGRRHVVRDLDDEQFTFVIEAILNGDTDREISAAFEARFKKPLAKSSLERWRKSSGNQLAERYRLVRYQAKQLLADLKQEDADKFQVVMGNIEDRLLTATREVLAADPMKMLRLRLDEGKRRLREREIDLKERQLALDEDQANASKVDWESLPTTIIETLLEYVGNDPAGLKWINANVKRLGLFLSERFGPNAKTNS
jgi:hypothetical protein